MPIDILMPALSPSMEHATLARWIKREGDAIQTGDILAEMETDKTVLEIKSVHEGILSKILVPDGTPDVQVNSLIAVMLGLDERLAEEVEVADSRSLEQEISRDDASPLPNREMRIFASPLARRLAAEARIDLATVRGSGPRGRIIEKDILAAQASRAVTHPEPAKLQPGPIINKHAASLAVNHPAEGVAVPHGAMRRTIARRLSEAKRTIPHFYLNVDCDIDALLKIKDEINQVAPLDERGAPRYKLTVNDFVIKAWALALERTPDAHVTWTEEAILKYSHVDVGVAVSIPGGLMTPVIKQAELKSLFVLSNEIKELATRAKNRKLMLEEYEGGTTSISNLGMFGISNFTAILSPSHATILAVGVGEHRVVVKDRQPAIATMMSCTVSVDHRAIDGALAAQLLIVFKRLIEAPVQIVI